MITTIEPTGIFLFTFSLSANIFFTAVYVRMHLHLSLRSFQIHAAVISLDDY